MASCEKCWRDAHGDPELYAILIGTRTGTADECTPEQQAGGDDAGVCRTCERKTVHCVVKRCVNVDCDAYYEICVDEESAADNAEG